MNPFAILLGRELLIDHVRWTLEDAHDTRCVLKHVHQGEPIRIVLTPVQLCDAFAQGRASWR